MVCTSAGETPKTQTTLLEIMFELAKHTKRSSKSSSQWKKFDLFESKESTTDYLRKISKEGEDGLKDFDNMEIRHHYTEDDAIMDSYDYVTQRSNPWYDFKFVAETITGTALGEVYDIGQREDRWGVTQRHRYTDGQLLAEWDTAFNTMYSTQIFAGAGDDLIIGSHQIRPITNYSLRDGEFIEWGKAYTVQFIVANGGPGWDNYVSTERHGTMFKINEMESAETLTTHPSYNQLELVREFDSGRRKYEISSSDSDMTELDPKWCDELVHTIYVNPGHEIRQFTDADGNNVFQAWPEFLDHRLLV